MDTGTCSNNYYINIFRNLPFQIYLIIFIVGLYSNDAMAGKIITYANKNSLLVYDPNVTILHRTTNTTTKKK